MNDSATLTTVAVLWAALAAYWDLRTKRIPNWLTYPAIGLGLAANGVFSGLSGLRTGLLGTLAGAALLIAPFAMGGMGAGDVKMLAAIGAIAGPSVAWRSFLYGGIAGGLIAATVMVGRWLVSREDRRLETGDEEASGTRRSRAMAFPYGIAIFAGVVVAWVLR